jgi:hypothetical protein
MKTQPVELTPELFHQMDGRPEFLDGQVRKMRDGLADEAIAGDAVDFAIAAALNQAARQGAGKDEVLSHLRYIQAQLAVFTYNLETL